MNNEANGFNIEKYLRDRHASTDESNDSKDNLIQMVARSVDQRDRSAVFDAAAAEVVPEAQRLGNEAGQNMVAIAIDNQNIWLQVLQELEVGEFKDNQKARTDISALKKEIGSTMLPEMFKEKISAEQDDAKKHELLEKIASQTHDLAALRIMRDCDAGKITPPVSREQLMNLMSTYLGQVARQIGLGLIDRDLPGMTLLDGQQLSFLDDKYIRNSIDQTRLAGAIMIREYISGRPVTTSTSLMYSSDTQRRNVSNVPPVDLSPAQRQILAVGAYKYVDQLFGALSQRFVSGGDLDISHEDARHTFMNGGNGVEQHLDRAMSQLFYGFSGEARVAGSDRSEEYLAEGRGLKWSTAKQQSESYHLGRALRAVCDGNEQNMLMSVYALSEPVQNQLKDMLLHEIELGDASPVVSGQNKESLAKLIVSCWGADELQSLNGADKQRLGVDNDNNKWKRFATESLRNYRDLARGEVFATLRATKRSYDEMNPLDQLVADARSQPDQINTLRMSRRVVYDYIAQEVIEQQVGRPSETGHQIATSKAELISGLKRLDTIKVRHYDQPEVDMTEFKESSEATRKTLFKLAFLRDVSLYYESSRRADSKAVLAEFVAYLDGCKGQGIQPAELLALHSSYLKARTIAEEKVLGKTQESRGTINDILTPHIEARSNAIMYGVEKHTDSWHTTNVKHNDPNYYDRPTDGVVLWNYKSGDERRAHGQTTWIGVDQSTQVVDSLVKLRDGARPIAQAEKYRRLFPNLVERFSDHRVNPSSAIERTARDTLARMNGVALQRSDRLPAILVRDLTVDPIWTSGMGRNADSHDPKELTRYGEAAKKKSGGIIGVGAKSTPDAIEAQDTMAQELVTIAKKILLLRGLESNGDPINEAGISPRALETYGGVVALQKTIDGAIDAHKASRYEAGAVAVNEFAKVIKSPEELSRVILGQMLRVDPSVEGFSQRVLDALTKSGTNGVTIAEFVIDADSEGAIYDQCQMGQSIDNVMTLAASIAKEYKRSVEARFEAEYRQYNGLNGGNIKVINEAKKLLDTKFAAIDNTMKTFAATFMGAVDQAYKKRAEGRPVPTLQTVVVGAGLPQYISDAFKDIK